MSPNTMPRNLHNNILNLRYDKNYYKYYNDVQLKVEVSPKATPRNLHNNNKIVDFNLSKIIRNI